MHSENEIHWINGLPILLAILCLPIQCSFFELELSQGGAHTDKRTQTSVTSWQCRFNWQHNETHLKCINAGRVTWLFAKYVQRYKSFSPIQVTYIWPEKSIHIVTVPTIMVYNITSLPHDTPHSEWKDPMKSLDGDH